MKDIGAEIKERLPSSRKPSYEDLSDEELVEALVKNKSLEDLTDDELLLVEKIYSGVGSDKLGPSRKAEAALQAYGKQATFGLLPELQAASEKVTFPLFEAAENVKRFAMGEPSVQVPADDFSTAREYYTERQKSLEEQHPILSTVSGLAGDVVSFAPILKGTSLAAKAIGKGAQKVMPATAEKVAEAAKTISESKRILPRLGKFAYENIALGPSAAVHSALQSDTTETGDLPSIEKRLERAEESLYTAPLFGAGIGAAFKGLSSAGRIMSPLITGVHPDTISRYIKNPELIQAAERSGLKDLSEEVDKIVGRIRADLENSKISVDEASRHLEETRKFLLQEAKTNKRDLELLVEQKSQDLKDRIKEKIDNLEAISAPSYIVEDVKNSVKQLVSDLKKYSDESLDIITQEGIRINTSPIVELIENAKKQFEINGVVYDAAKGVVSAMDDLKKFIETIRHKEDLSITGENAKNLLKIIDKSAEFYAKSPGIAQSMDSLEISIRNYLKRALTEASTDYKNIMATEVAPRADLLSRLRKFFGHEGDPTNKQFETKLGNIDFKNYAPEREALVLLGKFTDNDFSSRLANFIATKEEVKALKKASLNDPVLQKYFAEEIKSYDQLSQTLKEIKNKLPHEINAEIESVESMKRAQEGLEKAKSSYLISKEMADHYDFFLKGPSSVKISNYLKEMSKPEMLRSPEVIQAWESLTQLSDSAFKERIQALADAAGFNPTIVYGSKKAFWSMLWSRVGYTLGKGGLGLSAGAAATGSASGAIIGAGIGLAFAGLTEAFGPTVTKQVLDLYLGTLKGGKIITSRLIKDWNLPDDVKKFLIKDFKLALVNLANGKIESKVAVPEDLAAAFINEIKTTDALNNTEKAQNLNSLKENGTVNNFDKLMGVDVDEDEEPEKGFYYYLDHVGRGEESND